MTLIVFDLLKFKKGVFYVELGCNIFIIALVAAVLGFTNIAGSAIDIAKILFLVFLVLAVVSFIFGRRVSA